MSSVSHGAAQLAPGSRGTPGRDSATVAMRACPACREVAQSLPIERYGGYELFACAGCGLQFWDPRVMPAPGWYEQMYGGRDARLMSLEPGHRYFLGDPRAPGRGNLLDIGCGTGNFLAAAQSAGYRVTGTELDGNAARFAKERLGLERVLPLGIAQFSEQHSEEKFDVVTFFEVLEHQAEPIDFLERVKACLRSKGYVALSVPNRERWLTGMDPLDYPPNHFVRWNVGSLSALLGAQGFEMLTLREQPVGIAHAAQMINMRLRTGLTKPIAGREQPSFRDVMQNGAGGGDGFDGGKSIVAATRGRDPRANQACGVLSASSRGAALSARARLQRNVPLLFGADAKLKRKCGKKEESVRL
jgi:SAM-dependent methyltransferase